VAAKFFTKDEARRIAASPSGLALIQVRCSGSAALSSTRPREAESAQMKARLQSLDPAIERVNKPHCFVA
jgi:hypothetical protein